jgi:hypothetical protein
MAVKVNLIRIWEAIADRLKKNCYSTDSEAKRAGYYSLRSYLEAFKALDFVGKYDGFVAGIITESASRCSGEEAVVDDCTKRLREKYVSVTGNRHVFMHWSILPELGLPRLVKFRDFCNEKGFINKREIKALYSRLRGQEGVIISLGADLYFQEDKTERVETEMKLGADKAPDILPVRKYFAAQGFKEPDFNIDTSNIGYWFYAKLRNEGEAAPEAYAKLLEFMPRNRVGSELLYCLSDASKKAFDAAIADYNARHGEPSDPLGQSKNRNMNAIIKQSIGVPEKLKGDYRAELKALQLASDPVSFTGRAGRGAVARRIALAC